MTTSRIISIVVLCVVCAVFVLGIIGFIIFKRRVSTKKTAIKIKRQLKKNATWWACCWAAWLVIGLLSWNNARLTHNAEKVTNYALLFAAGILITILLLLDFTVGKYAYITSQRVYFPDNFGLARQKKNIMYRITGDRLKLWFGNALMPKEFEVIEKHEELKKLLKDYYKINKVTKD